MSSRIRRRPLRWLLGLGLLLTGFGGEIRAADRPPKIGVVNITKVFDSYKKKRVLEEDLRMTREQKTRVIRERDKEIKRLADEVRMLELGSEERKKREAELEKKQVELQSFTQVTTANLATQKREITEKLYTEIADAVTDYGRQNGFDLIIKWENVEIKSASLDELLYKINQRTVLFAAGSVDITDAIVKTVNSRYSKEIIEK